MSEAILRVRNLKKFFPIKGGLLQRTQENIHAVDGVSFDVGEGECIGLVGESGCGKSTLGRCIIHLIEPTSGEILYRGSDVSGMDRKELWSRIQMVFQDPMSSLNPRLTIGYCVGEPLIVRKTPEAEVRARVGELLAEVGLNEEHYGRFPHEFSGGQRQRIMIARALITDPEFIILDEPTSSLDVSVQAKILNLLDDIKGRIGITYMFISHDLSVIKHLSDTILVMYLGKLVEIAPKRELFSMSMHPYTRLLIDSIPSRSRRYRGEHAESPLGLELPSNIDPPKGCRFHTRCPKAMDVCLADDPELIEVEAGHYVACHLYD
jgi:oligopeptide/dipeptide ABC transporter ATP-binding protein